MTDKLFFFIKFGNRQHMEALIEHGTIYMSTVDAMRKAEQGSGRGDPNEWSTRLMNFSGGEATVQLSFMDRRLNYKHLSYGTQATGDLGNVYCVSTLNRSRTIGLDAFRFDPRLTRFGDYFVLIKDLPTFMNRMQYGVAALGNTLSANVVRYYDPLKHRGDLGVFDKENKFSYQQEFRFHAQGHPNGPLSFDIGSLREIAELFPSSALEELVCKPMGLRKV